MAKRLKLTVFILSLALVLYGCGGNLTQKIEDSIPELGPDYKHSSSMPPLEVPPDLTSDSINSSNVIPGAKPSGSSTYSEYASQSVASIPSQAGVLPSLDEIQVERSGDKRWLVIKAKPSQVWPKLREFWLNSGFLLKMEDPRIGIMETDWAENRADIPQGIIRSLLARVSDALYSAATRDKFRVRLERGATAGFTELFVTHRGAEEVSQGDTFVWQPRPSDPELEAEMLNRIVVYFGVGKQKAATMIANKGNTRPLRATVIRDGKGNTALSLKEGFSRAWRRTGLALDRVGFTVEDRDRSRGLYYVRYVDPMKEGQKEEGWFSQLSFFADDDDDKPKDNDYLISLVGEGQRTQVSVLNKQGQRDASPTADRILSLLHEQLK